MTQIPAARQSPQVRNGCLSWYAGDTFELTLALLLRDQDGESVTLGPEDTVEVQFFDAEDQPVRTFTFTQTAQNTVCIRFDADVTAQFPRGDYAFDVRCTALGRTTLAHRTHCHVA